LNYEDPIAVSHMIPATWWLEHKSCKYILSVLVHKNNKDIATRPAQLPPGPTRNTVREKTRSLIGSDRATAKGNRRIEVVDEDGATKTVRVGEVEADAKRAQVDGMRSVIEKNKIDSIERKISIMQKLEELYVGRHGREWYESQLLHLVNQLPGMLGGGGVDIGRGDRNIGGEATTTPQSGVTNPASGDSSE
jgi:hypothetical protein